ncbi:DUF6783 domain-containing protein, partial [Mediterraneibacter gnavus]|uniref:DUF6783 domain-containing protein n=1 Tax=Mediterraneibacter gnavus TaxID=33038 RepID=UPI00299F7342
MCVTICGRFCPDEGAVAGYGNRIRAKSPAKWGVQIAGMIFQTRSKARGCGIEKKSKTVARKLEILCQNIRLSVRILWLCLRAWLVAW